MTTRIAILSRKSILAQAWPIILSQASVPLVGLVDTAVIGRTGDETALAAVSLGAVIINFIFWSFGFLRMGMTGLTSQAHGANDLDEVQALLMRSACIGAGLGLLIMLAQHGVLSLALTFMSGSPAAESGAADYAAARFWGAPAALAVYAVNGWLLGLGRTGAALALQIVMNSANAVFDIVLVTQYGMGPAGVGAGTAAAEWTALILAVPLCWLSLRRLGGFRAEAFDLRRLVAASKLKRMFVVNADIMVRTIALLTLFTWFTNAGARQGDVMLAANHVLAQVMAIAAFVLDAFAFTAEERVGAAIGAGDKPRFWRAIRLTSEFALGGGVLLAITFILFGGPFIAILTSDPDVQDAALRFLPLAAAVSVIGAPAWMMDGIFVGATRTSALRNAALISTALYIILDLTLRPFGNWGVWAALTTSYVLRSVCLGLYVPALVKSITAGDFRPDLVPVDADQQSPDHPYRDQETRP